MSAKTQQKKMCKLDDFLSEPAHFNDGTYVISATLFPTIEDALKTFKDYFAEGYDKYDKNFTLENIQKDYCRFECQGVHDGNGDSGCMYWLGKKETDRGARPVWTLYLERLPGETTYL